MKKTILFLCLCYLVGVTYAQEPFRVMFYNVENLFDCQHDTLKNDYEFQRFLLRGKTRVKLEILLLCMGYNINKLHAKIQKERLGSYLFPVKETA